MGIPQVPAQIRRTSLLAIRAVFTGIGRALMVADRPTPAADNARAPAKPLAAAHADGAAAAVADETVSATAAENEHAAGTASTVGLPLPNYDTLSLASIRARLRGLDVAQLKVLLDYEATNAERAEVLGMFQRRIEKLEADA